VSTDLEERTSGAPSTHRLSLLLLGAFLSLGLLTVALVALLRERMVLNWAEGHREAREIVAQRGLDYLMDERPIAVPQFFAVSAVLFITVASLVIVLTMFYAHGHHWARVCLTVLLVMIAIATGSGMRVDPPVTFLVLSWLAIGLVVALLVTMWHPNTSEHLRATQARVDAGAP
jgi:hypothetical protein